uniref:Arginyltransferase n=1 Tax=Alexandrium monilatum TaxID=311494 RepID=A0A7S4SEX1_9DINO|mmetsp:Transcript_38898/g.121062  ORF Transcript_38898/g.121062 Transcript_38898/m.121062 type:complete len:538 (+) Transcript_38898:128-1741(+)
MTDAAAPGEAEAVGGVWSRIVGDEGGAVCCSDCGYAVALEQHRRGEPKQTRQEDHVILCRQFNRADGAVSSGPSMSEGARFKGWTFRLSNCGECSAHLGWCYEREGLPPFWEFVIDILQVEEPRGEKAELSSLPSPDPSSLAQPQVSTPISVYSPYYKVMRPVTSAASPLERAKPLTSRSLLSAISPLQQAIHGTLHQTRTSWVVRCGAPVSDAWARPEPKYRSKWMSHESLRRYDQDWRQAASVGPEQVRALRSYFPGPYIDSTVHTALTCKKLFLERRCEFGYSLDYSPAFFCELAYEGFFPMGLEHPQDRRIQVLGLCFDHQVHVLDFREVHVSRQVRRRAKQYTMTVDKAFDDVLLGCVRMHGEAWLYRGCRWVLRTLFHECRRPGTPDPGAAGVSVHSFELWDGEGKLVAGDIGYTLGSIYTSMTGFREQHTKSAGEVQLVLTAALLERMGFAWLDLGQVLKYKERLGAKAISRAAYLDRLHRDRDRPAHFGTDGCALDGQELLAQLVLLQAGDLEAGGASPGGPDCAGGAH